MIFETTLTLVLGPKIFNTALNCLSQKMTKEDLTCEKSVLQKNLLYYEGFHGRPVSVLHTQTHTNSAPSTQCSNRSAFLQVTREERLTVKHVYDRYRLVKQMLTRVSITPIIVSHSLSFLFTIFLPSGCDIEI